MTIDSIGLVAALTTFFSIWFGHVAVRKIEAVSPSIWLSYVTGFGVLLIIVSLFFGTIWISVLFGVFGASLIWGSTELKEQAVRAEIGWYPYNYRKILPPYAKVIEKWKAPHL